jgi:hypothetical protein
MLRYFQSHSVRHTIARRIPLDKESARRKHLYLARDTTFKTDISAATEFEPSVSANDQQQTFALGRSVIGIREVFN